MFINKITVYFLVCTVYEHKQCAELKNKKATCMKRRRKSTYPNGAN